MSKFGPMSKRLPYQYQVGKVPIIGPWYGRIGRIWNINSMPCAPEPLVIFQAAAVAAPRLLYSLFGPDCIDDAYDWLKGGAKKGKGPGIKPRGGHRRGVGWKTQGSKNAPGYGDGSLQDWVIPLGDLAQRIGWYMAVIDTSLEGVVNFSSLVYQYSGCKGFDTPYAQAKLNEGLPLAPFGGVDQVVAWEKTGAHIFNVGFAELVVPSGYNPGVGFSLATGPNPFGLPDAKWEAQLYNSNSSWEHPWITPTKGPDGKQSATYYDFSAYRDEPGGSYRVLVRRDSGVFWATSGTFNGYGANKGDLKLGIKPSKCDPYTGGTDF
jgi:hypothetical protein